MIEDGILKEQGPVISENDRMSFAIFLAIAFHGLLLLGIAFTAPKKKMPQNSPSMQVVLAQYHAMEKPDKADFIGQDNQEGGGDKDRLLTPTTTEIAQIPDPSKQASISTPDQSSAQLIQKQPERLTSTNGLEKVFQMEQSDAQDISDQPLMDTATLIQKRFQLEGQIAQLDDSQQFASRNLRKRTISAAIHRSNDALYLDTWQKKIEAIGNEHYPDLARQKKIYGDLILKVSIYSNGTLAEVSIVQSSGHKILDDAAINIVKRAQPFAAFDDELKKDTDVLEIIRLWEFLPGDKVKTR